MSLHRPLIAISLAAVALLTAVGCIGARRGAPTNGAGAVSEDALFAPSFERDGRRFTRLWLDELDRQPARMKLADWTFPTNAVEFRPENAVFAGGKLTLEVSAKHPTDPEKHAGKRLWGAELFDEGRYRHGRFVARVRPSAPSGVVTSVFTAFYRFDAAYKLLETAELDIEWVGTTRAVQLTVHWVDAAGVKQEKAAMKALPFDASAAFHVWEIEWTPDRVAFFVDGTALHTITDSAILAELDHPQDFRMNSWVSEAAGWAGSFDPGKLPVRSEYDRLAVYRLER